MESDNKNLGQGTEIQPEDNQAGGKSADDTASPNVKKRKLIAIIASVTLVVLVGVFLGVFFGVRNQPQNKFARAQKAWDSDSKRAVTDDVTILLAIGEGDATLTIETKITGKRSFENGESKFEYYVIVDFLLGGSPITLIELAFDAHIADVVKVKLEAMDGALRKDFKAIDKTLPLSEVNKYSFDKASFYNLSKININNKGSFTVVGDSSFDFILEQLAPVLESVTNMDLLSMIEDYIQPHAVRGQVAYAKGRFQEISSLQNISVYIPWEELDEKLEEVNLPDSIRTILETKKIAVLFASIDLLNYCPTGFAVNIKVDSSGKFESKA